VTDPGDKGPRPQHHDLHDQKQVFSVALKNFSSEPNKRCGHGDCWMFIVASLCLAL